MKKFFQFLHFDAACRPPKAGIIPSKFAPPSPVTSHSVSTPMSGVRAYRNGHVRQTAFVYALRTNSLYTPSKSFRNTFKRGAPTRVDRIAMRYYALKPRRPRDPPRFPRKEAFISSDDQDRPLCPLCDGPSPDTHHYASHECPNTFEMSSLLRRSVASLIQSLNAFVPSAPPLADSLLGWLRSVVPEVRPSDILSPLRDGSAQFISGPLLQHWPDQGLNLPPSGYHFGLFPTKLLFYGNCPLRFQHLLFFPANRAILSPGAGEGGDYVPPTCYDHSLSLVMFGDKALPPVDQASVDSLAERLRSSLVWGPLRLSLRWSGTSWPLDALIEDPQPILDQAGILPLDAARPTRENTDLPSTLTYACLLPGEFPGPVGRNLKTLPLALRKQFREELLHCLIVGQYQLWRGTRSAIAQVLSYRRRAAIAAARGRPPPGTGATLSTSNETTKLGTPPVPPYGNWPSCGSPSATPTSLVWSARLISS